MYSEVVYVKTLLLSQQSPSLIPKIEKNDLHTVDYSFLQDRGRVRNMTCTTLCHRVDFVVLVQISDTLIFSFN